MPGASSGLGTVPCVGRIFFWKKGGMEAVPRLQQGRK